MNENHIRIFYLSGAIFTALVFLVSNAYAQSGSGLDHLIEGGINNLTDKFTDNIDLSNGNPLNVTKQETDDLTESGKGMFFAVYNLISASHKLGESIINFLSPYPVQSIIVFLVAGAITVVIVLSLLKRLAIHLLIFVIVTLILIGVFVFFYFG